MPHYVRVDDGKPLTILPKQEQPFFLMNVTDAISIHCVYTHEIFDGIKPPVVIYAGVSRLNELFAYADARRNSEWIKYVTPERPIMTRIIATGDFLQCSNYRAKLIQELTPHCNLRGYDVASNLRIRCINDDKTFDTIADVCRHYACSPSAVSNHLNNKPGHKSVKGRVFERITRD